jgi:hypothetical protein
MEAEGELSAVLWKKTVLSHMMLKFIRHTFQCCRELQSQQTVVAALLVEGASTGAPSVLTPDVVSNLI